MIPKRLQEPQYRFIKIDMTDPENRKWKKPLELDWQHTNNYQHTDKKFNEYLKKGDNYGVALGYGGLIVIDADHILIEQTVRKKLPDTFRVKTGGYYFDKSEYGRKIHSYFICPELTTTIVLDEDPGGNHYGEIRTKGAMVIGPESKHYDTGNTYEVENDVPIATITVEQLNEVMSPFMTEYSIKKKIKEEYGDKEGKCFIDITKIINPEDYTAGSRTEQDKGIYRGKHPVHDSGTNRNFTFDINNGLWYCQRHGTGGSALELSAVINGVIDCKDCKKGAIRGEIYQKAITTLKEKYNIDFEKEKQQYDENKAIEEIMTKNNIDREQAWTIYKNRIELEEQRKRFEERGLKIEFNKNMATLTNVYSVLDKYLYLPDKRRVDLILAVALSMIEKGTPIWVVIVGPSGDCKSEIIRSLEHLDNTIKIDQITPNTLASGKNDVIKDAETKKLIRLKPNDLGSKLQDKSTLLLVPDMAVFSSKSTDDKNLIWAQFRNLYDGFINKMTGNGVERVYENCHVTLLGCSTPIIRDEFIVHAQLGTRELMWDTGIENNTNEYDRVKVQADKTIKAWENERYEQQMRKDIAEAVLNFIGVRQFKRIPEENIPDNVKNFLISEATRLSILRASVIIDQSNREVNNPVVNEVPTRLIKQFKRIYMGLKSLDDNYTDERILSIIKTLVDSSGNVVRQMVMETLKYNWKREYTIKEVHTRTKIGKNSVKAQLEILWNLGVVEKEIRTERIGASLVTWKDENGNQHEDLRGGMIKDVEYYKWAVTENEP